MSTPRTILFGVGILTLGVWQQAASIPTAPTNKTATRHHEIFCDPPFLNIFNRGCYVFSHKIIKTRQEAQMLCKEMHPEGTLAELETSEEAVALAVYLNEHYSKCDGWALPGPWIGGVERGNQNIFDWPSTNTSIDCSNWEIGQPNSPTSKDGIALDCSKHYTWYDTKVDTVLPFVCESPPRPPSNGTQEGCRYPFTNIEDRYCYYFSGTNRLQRVHAQSYCKTLHPYGRLAEIETGEELVSLTLYLDDQDEQRKCGTWGAPGPWIGGEELGNTNVFTWSSDVELGAPSSLGVMISNWERGQPNSNTSNDGIALNCTNRYAWFDAQNSTELPFVCEAPYNLAECPENFIFIDGRCYLISESTTHRSTAIQRCQESNATLLELETSWEIRSITDYLLATCPGSCMRHYWLGMNPDPVHRVYKWISTGRPVTFNNWRSGYPTSYNNGYLALLNRQYSCKDPPQSVSMPRQQNACLEAIRNASMSAKAGTGRFIRRDAAFSTRNDGVSVAWGIQHNDDDFLPGDVKGRSDKGAKGGQDVGTWMRIPSAAGNVPRGLEYLTMVDQLLIQQKVQMFEAITGFEVGNKYSIKNTLGQKVPFVMKILDNTLQPVMTLERPLACDSCCCPCCLQTMDVLCQGQLVGSISQNWSIFPNLSVKDAAGNVVLKIEGPLCTCSFNCGDVDFFVKNISGQTVGKIQKQWSGCCKEAFTDAESFCINFPMDLDVQTKATLLGAALLIDFMYYEFNN
ncbi:unnamed protein product [Cyprideis torosa]|uniref:Uncharacterized protein n=1 Tax=Cyprideis torosa TaxID=163714 RepID=A0A7R8ZTH2_9CRUS|nr:unnamed protein product [Cyprideis torosa]CAG0897998.1 unnamed protein product [Cyprideis torosa]